MSRLLRAPAPRPTSGARPAAAHGQTRSFMPRRSIRSILRVERPPADPWTTVAVAGLVCIGVLMVFSASALNSLQNSDDAYALGLKQLLYVGVGVAALIALSAFDYRRWRAFATPFLVVAILLLVAVLIPGVPTERGLKRSLNIGPLSIHAAEVAKLALILFLAAHLSRRGHQLSDRNGTFLPAVAAIGTCLLLVLVEPDLGTAVIIGVIGFVLLFSSGLSLRWVLSAGATAAVIGGAGIALRSYQAARLGSFHNPFSDPLGSSYQTLQGLMSMALGGPLGTGLGSSQQPGGILVPYSWNDYIFAVIGQELGLLGALVVLGAFVLIAIRGLKISQRSPDTFGALLAIGITTWICAQAFMNIGVVLAVLPVTGVPLPLVSQGGSSMIVLLAAVGILLSVSRETMGEAERGGSDARIDRGRRDRGTSLPGLRHRPFSPPSSYRR